MFVRSKHYDNAIQKVTIRFGEELNLPEGEDCFVTFKEPSEEDVLKLRDVQEDSDTSIVIMKGLLINSVVDHDFYNDDESKMSAEEVIELLYEKVVTASKLIKEYTKAVFHSQANKDEEK